MRSPRTVRTAGPSERTDALAVYPPRADTYLLLPFADVPPGTTLLDVGTGSGELALAAARRGARVVATDRNPHALRRTSERARRESLSLALVRTDLARGLARFDRVLFNPPYLPTRPEERDPDRWHNLALDGGPDGTEVSVRWIRDLPAHLRPRGAAFLVVSSLQSPAPLDAARRAWARSYGSVDTVAHQPLEGETLEIWRFAAPERPAREA